MNRKEQAKFVRLLASLVESGFPINKVFTILAESYADYGVIPAEFDSPLSRGYISRQLLKAAKQIEKGTDVGKVISQLSFLDRDIREILRVAVEKQVLYQMSRELADFLRFESNITGAVKKSLIAPSIAFLIAYGTVYETIYKLIPKFVESFTLTDLPSYISFMLEMSKHLSWFLILTLVIGAVIFGIAKSGIWKKAIPVYSVYEKFKVVSFVKIMRGMGFTVLEVFHFLRELPLTKKWKQAIEQAISFINHGKGELEVVEHFKKLKLLSPTDVAFYRVGIEKGNVGKQLSYLIELMKEDAQDLIAKTETVVNVVSMSIVGGVIAFIYIGVIFRIINLVMSKVGG